MRLLQWKEYFQLKISLSPHEEFKYLQQIKSHSQSCSPPMRVKIKINHGKSINALIDSGCSKSLVNEEIKQHLQGHVIPEHQSPVVHNTAMGETASLGKINVQFKFPYVSSHETYEHMFEILPDSQDTLVMSYLQTIQTSWRLSSLWTTTSQTTSVKYLSFCQRSY
jgi:hypothetical protein